MSPSILSQIWGSLQPSATLGKIANRSDQAGHFTGHFTIYKAMTVDEAELQLSEFEAQWPKYPAIARLWRSPWERVIPFFAFPEEVRKIVYTTNAVESLHMSLRKIIKTRGSFPSEEAAFKLLYLALAKVVAKWETVQHWKQMLNHLDTVCGARIREAGDRQ